MVRGPFVLEELGNTGTHRGVPGLAGCYGQCPRLKSPSVRGSAGSPGCLHLVEEDLVLKMVAVV